jgi:hypothetical protein
MGAGGLYLPRYRFAEQAAGFRFATGCLVYRGGLAVFGRCANLSSAAQKAKG